MKCNQWVEGTIEPHGLPYCRCGGDIPDQWRDVREELPENTENVLVYVVGSIYLGWFFEDRWRGSHIIGAVTHWMPLPAPPSGKE